MVGAAVAAAAFQAATTLKPPSGALSTRWTRRGACSRLRL